ncbi:Rab geranylgeranyltransferase, variant 4 [Clarireedia jacksonii]
MASHGMPRAAATEQKSLAAVQKEKKEIEDYKALVQLVEAKVAERQYTLEVLQLTSKLLSKNPEYYTIWNVRRRLLIYGLFSKSSESTSQSAHPSSSTFVHGESSMPGAKSSSSTSNTSTTSITTQPDPKSPNHGKNGTVHELIQADLDFIFPLMVGWPKCYWIWNYRLWLLKQANERLDAEAARRLWERELVLVGKMLTRDSRNFHGWGYRRTVVSQLESPELNGSSMVESEFEYTTRMITRELKNFSAWHNRSKLIPRLLDERKATGAERRKFLDDEFDIITRAMWNDAYPYDQSVWFYHQFLMSTLTEAVGHATITPNFTRDDRIEYIQRQLVNLRDFQDGGEDCKWVYNALLEYTLAVCEMEERLPRHDEVEDCKAWLSQLRKLDPMREGRWNDLEKTLKINRVLSEGQY